MKKAIVLLLLVLLFSLIWISSAKEKILTVGAKDYTEQDIVGSLMKILLEEHGYKVAYHDGMAGPSLRRSLIIGDIDVCMEYPATAWFVYLVRPEILPPDAIYNQLKEEDLERGILWLERTGFKNSYALAMREEEAEEIGIKTISDLANYVNDHPKELGIAADHRFYFRPDGLHGVERAYEFRFYKPDIKPVIRGLVHGLLNSGEVDVAAVFVTEPQIQKFEFMVLEDDKGFFPQYSLAPVLREEIAEEYPEVVELLNMLSAAIDDQETMLELNIRAYMDKEDPDDMAREFLREKGLIEG